MAQILGPGESLNVGEERTDETRRFKAVLQADGNFVVYGYRIDPIQGFALGASNTANFGADVRLHMNPGGWLEILKATDGSRRWYRPIGYRPDSRGFGLENVPKGTPNSALHLQGDGRLVIYRPGGYRSSDATWAIAGGLSQETRNACVIPGTLTVDISEGGTISSSFDKAVVNESDVTIGVRDGRNFAAVPPGGQIAISTPGSINVSTRIYFPTDEQGSSGDAVSTKVYGPDKTVIKIGGTSGSGGFSLT